MTRFIIRVVTLVAIGFPIATIATSADAGDKQERQVLIEARILETTSRFTREIGVDWGNAEIEQRRDRHEYSWDSSLDNNLPILRETGDSTGIFRGQRNTRSANRDRGITNAREVPQLGDVPTLGRLFRYQDKTRRQSELLILVTPRIVETED